MVKYVLASDLHLSEYTEEVVFSILSYLASLNTKVAILGDFYDEVYRTSCVDVRLQNRLLSFFKAHFTKDKLFMIPGNHDQFSSYEFDHALHCFSSVATIYTTAHCDEDGVAWLPYKKGGYNSAEIRELKRRGAKVVFTHNDFKYLETRKGYLSEEGMNPSLFNGIKVFNGHYHFPNRHQNVQCIGSLYSVHKNEVFDQKVLVTVEIRGDIIQTSIKNVRFGRRNFVYPISYCREIYDTWKENLVPTKPTIQDTLTLEYELGDDLSLQFLNFLDCPIVLRKQPQSITKKEVNFRLNDIPFQMILNASTQIFRSSLVDENVQKTMKLFKQFKKQHIETFTDSCTTHLVISTLVLDNFCGKSATVHYNKGVTKIVGANGAGKTVQYASALLYAFSGILDSRFSEERMLVSDLGGSCSVKVNGTINDKPYEITRGHTGTKSLLEFHLDGKRSKCTTVKNTQKEICKVFFNVYNVIGCPNKFAHTLMLQRVVWNQTGKSNILKYSKRLLRSTLLGLFNESQWLDFEDFLIKKSKLEEKKLEQLKQIIDTMRIKLDERKSYLEMENVGLSSWQQHRKKKINDLQIRIEEMNNNSIDFPTEFTDIAQYCEWKSTLLNLNDQLRDMLSSKEGLRWTPERSMVDVHAQCIEIDKTNTSLTMCNKVVENYLDALKIVRIIKDELYEKICDILSSCYDNKIDLTTKTQSLIDGSLVKYFSGGEYEFEALQFYLDYQQLIREYKNWTCNLLVFDEPGTALSTAKLQQFVDKLPKNKAIVMISHKDIKCAETINLSINI